MPGMHYKLIKFSLLLLIMVTGFASKAKVRMPSVFSDNMLLQRDTVVPIWGFAKPGEKVVALPSWSSSGYSAVAGTDGYWKLYMDTPVEPGPFSIKISDGDTVEIKNILMGEVWICSGQSNMRHNLCGYPGQPVNGSFENIISADSYNKKVRMFIMDLVGSESPCQDVPNGRWLECNVHNAYYFSAVPFFFAKKLSDMINIPVGIISSNWGGSSIAAWVDESSMKNIEGVNLEVMKSKDRKVNQRLGYLYNSMIYPLREYTMRGILWYQGESDTRTPYLYSRQIIALTKLWRQGWKNDRMPFYIAQLPPHSYGNSLGTNLPEFVEAQIESVRHIPYSGIIATTDLGDEHEIHHAYKDVIGERFAYMALVDTYGKGKKRGLPATGPMAEKMEIVGNKIILTFENHCGLGLLPKHESLPGFELAGDDNVFYEAEARVIGNTSSVEVSCDKVKKPKNIRYAFRNYCKATLCDIFGFPAFPYRSDRPVPSDLFHTHQPEVPEDNAD